MLRSTEKGKDRFTSTPNIIEYWRLQEDALLKELDTSAMGLDEAEAARRLKEYGLNEIPHAGHRTTINILLSQFKNPLVYVLVFASMLAGFMGNKTEAIIIVAIMLINATLGFAQEYRSDRVLDGLRKYLSYTTVVLREGKKHVIGTRELVPGDVVFLVIGDVVPADIRLLEVHELQTNESTLTGESTPVDKDAKPIELYNPLPHQLSNIALMGSTITNGSGTGLVVSTGKHTYFGRVASSLSMKPPITDFQRNIMSLGNLIVKLVLAFTAFIFIANSVLGHGILESLIFSLAITVAIMPEALPAIITVGLSNGALRLAKKKVIVRRLETIENIGNVDVLCTDKTGTLTQNEIKVQDIVDLQGHSRPELIKYGLLCNSAVVEGNRILGDPIDVAIWKHARDEGYDEASLKGFSCLHVNPFQANRRRMSFVVENDGCRLLISKGAPESILGISTEIGDGIEAQIGKEGRRRRRRQRRQFMQAKKEVNSLIEKYSQAGSRLIALSYKEIEDKSDYSAEDEHDLTFTGLLVLNDPPKEDAANAISRLKSLDIKLKVLSGDDPIVTADVCHKVGIDTQERVITGMDLEKKQESELRQLVEDHDVFGRVTPDQKLSIVSALKENGHVTGFLGDGVNDAPSLRLADAGISVDSGVQVAKDASSIILLEKSLSVIADGAVEGRKAFSNMMKYITNTMSGNFAHILTLALCSLFLPFIPMLPSQLLLINLLTDAPLVTLSTDNVEEERLRTPKRQSTGSIMKFMVYNGAIDSTFDFVTIISLVYVLHTSMELFRTVWFIQSILHEIIETFAIRTKKRFYKSKPSNLLIVASAIVAALTLIVVYSPVGLFFEFVIPPLWSSTLIFGILALYFFIIETTKYLYMPDYF